MGPSFLRLLLGFGAFIFGLHKRRAKQVSGEPKQSIKISLLNKSRDHNFDLLVKGSGRLSQNLSMDFVRLIFLGVFWVL